MKGEVLVKEIQIKNFRSLKDTGLQTLSPITVLVGENSSGKSTFLRAFPLLKQSINKRTSGPILWSGDVDDYVDFGSFGETVTNDESDSISFKFTFSLEEGFVGYKLYPMPHVTSGDKHEVHHVSFELTIASYEGKEQVSYLVLCIDEAVFCFDLIKQSVSINNSLYVPKAQKKSIDDIDRKSIRRNRYLFTGSRAFEFYLPDFSEYWDELVQYIEYDKIDEDSFDVFFLQNSVDYIGGRFCKGWTIEKISEQLSKKKKKQREYYNASLEHTCSAFLQKLKVADSRERNRIENLIMLCFVYGFFSEIDEYIVQYFKQVHYIAPLRATAERYYRLRNLAVDEVDYQGKNLAIFINSLSKKEMSDFRQWTNEQFGFAISTDKDKGHISLQIELSGSHKAINLSDTGFGYSQVLPIITQLWVLSTRKKEESSAVPLIVAIEQPELHLHPAVQAKLAKTFLASINLARKNGYQIQILLETHSDTIVNYFGKAIARGQLKPEDVSVILFDKCADESITTVKTSSYDNDGFLSDWPYGFFAPEE